MFAAPAFPVQAFPNGYPGYPIRGDSSQPSLADDHGHSLMGLEDQVRFTHATHYRFNNLKKIIISVLLYLCQFKI